MVAHGGNRASKKHLKRSEGYIKMGTDGVRLVRRIDRFTGEYIGECQVGDYDWIWKIVSPDGKTENHPYQSNRSHFKDGDPERNMVTLEEHHITIRHTQHEAILKEILGE